MITKLEEIVENTFNINRFSLVISCNVQYFSCSNEYLKGSMIKLKTYYERAMGLLGQWATRCMPRVSTSDHLLDRASEAVRLLGNIADTYLPKYLCELSNASREGSKHASPLMCHPVEIADKETPMPISCSGKLQKRLGYILICSRKLLQSIPQLIKNYFADNSLTLT